MTDDERLALRIEAQRSRFALEQAFLQLGQRASLELRRETERFDPRVRIAADPWRYLALGFGLGLLAGLYLD